MRGCYPIRDFNHMDELCGDEGFKHNWQGVRVAARLDPPLNLTKYTLWGILNHSSLNYKKCDKKKETENEKLCLFRHDESKECMQTNEKNVDFYKKMLIYDQESEINIYDQIKDCWSFEGYVVAVADEIAQRHHDIEDAIEYNLVMQDELIEIVGKILGMNEQSVLEEYCIQPQVMSNADWKQAIEESKRNFIDVQKSKSLDNKDDFEAKLSKFIVNFLTSDVIYNLRYIFDKLIEEFGLSEKETFSNISEKIRDRVQGIFSDTTFFSEDMKIKDKEIQGFLSSRILNSQEAQKMDGVGQYILRETFKAYLINPQLLPDKTLIKLYRNYYQSMYGCKWKEKLRVEGLLKENSQDMNIGAIRNDLNKVHFKDINIQYKKVLLRTICDYIAGMTDKYIIDRHREFYNISY